MNRRSKRSRIPVGGHPRPTSPEEASKLPCRMDEILELKIVDLAFGGEGVARLQDYVIFVPFTLPGETVLARVTELKKKFGRAELEEIVVGSPDRVRPECGLFQECGGCQYQHIAYPRQLEIKTKQVRDLMQRIGGIDPNRVDPVAPCPSPYGYRNRIMVRSQWNGRLRKLEIGFMRYDNRWVVNVDHCPIAEPALNAQIGDVHRNPPPKGGLKVVLRMMPEDWKVHPDSFFQNNFHMLPGLVQAVRERLIAAGTSHLIDAYCGVGFFGIELADLVKSFAGVELDKRAIQAARENAADRGITNADFVDGKTEDHLEALLDRFERPQTTVILDPPRRGCVPETLQQLAKAAPAQILYVSCHPATLARDLKILCDTGGYTLEKITPVDMFPQTQHVECVADLRLNPAMRSDTHPAPELS